MAVVTGEFSWVQIQNPDSYKNGPLTRKVTITVSDADAEVLRAEGKQSKKGAPNEFTFGRPVEWPSGEKRDVPKVVDENRNPIDSLVGNGSKGKLQYNMFTAKSGNVGWDLCAIQVTELVPYGAAEDGSEFEDASSEFGDEIPF